ncbi:MAG: LysR family transcriptional regulator [Bacteroidaceae bacterium]|nr:LysR family transcriptional regulator [Bacteroidaceae bacterium]
MAVNKHRHFVKAAQECGVSQPTLSAMVQKLEQELDVKIFDRDKSPIEPTEIGLKIISQAETSINDVNRIQEIILSEKSTMQGNLRIGVAPTIAPYLVPQFITRFRLAHKEVELRISEIISENIESDLLTSDIDIGILSTPFKRSEFLEIPLYNERFLAYFSPQNPCQVNPLTPENMPTEKLWVLMEGKCATSEVFNFCKMQSLGETSYKAGSIDTLIRIVDVNGGNTVIPELHTQFLTPEQQRQLTLIESPDAQREVSIIIRKDYVKEKMLNAVVNIIKQIIPEKMLVPKIRKFKVRL